MVRRQEGRWFRALHTLTHQTANGPVSRHTRTGMYMDPGPLCTSSRKIMKMSKPIVTCFREKTVISHELKCLLADKTVKINYVISFNKGHYF